MKTIAEIKKVFISQPMNGLTDLQISKDRAMLTELYNRAADK